MPNKASPFCFADIEVREPEFSVIKAGAMVIISA
jgi:hypothetical protein